MIKKSHPKRPTKRPAADASSARNLLNGKARPQSAKVRGEYNYEGSHSSANNNGGGNPPAPAGTRAGPGGGSGGSGARPQSAQVRPRTADMQASYGNKRGNAGGAGMPRAWQGGGILKNSGIYDGSHSAKQMSRKTCG